MTNGLPTTPSPPPSSSAGGVGSATGLPSAPTGAETDVIDQALRDVIPNPPATIGRARGSRVRQRTGAWPAGGTPRVDPNSLEAVADDVAFWIEATAQEVARAMYDGIHAPFAARISSEEQARYYAETLFQPDGTLDPQQWWAEYARVGPDGLAKAINGGAAYRRARGLAVLLPASKFQQTGVGPDSAGMIGVTPAGGWPETTRADEEGPGSGPPEAYPVAEPAP